MGKEKITRGKKKTSPQNGEMHVSREHRLNGVTVAKDHGSKEFDPEELPQSSIDSLVAEAGANIERTVQPEQYEALRIGVFCRLPCSLEDMKSGKAFKVVHAMCRKELSEQLQRGLEGLESPFKRR